MNDVIAISTLAAGRVREMIEQSERLQTVLQATVEALAAQLEVPPGWRFDVRAMAFMPPADAVGTVVEPKTAPDTAQ